MAMLRTIRSTKWQEQISFNTSDFLNNGDYWVCPAVGDRTGAKYDVKAEVTNLGPGFIFDIIRHNEEG